MIPYPELLRRTEATRHQIDWIRKRYGALVRPQRIGWALFFDPSSVQVVNALMAKARGEKHFSH